MPMQDDQAERLTLAQAAVRLGVTQDTVRRRIKRRELTAIRDNRGRFLVLLPPTEAPGAPRGFPPRQDDSELIGELRTRIESLERRLDEAQAERRQRQEAHEAEQAQLLALLETALVERRLPERRPWPGLRAWWRRLIEGEG